jgi:tRNA modification GTPase
LGIEDVVEVIRKEILRLTDGAGQEEGAIAASARQHEAIGRLVRILDGASGALATAPTEVALVDLHEALGVVSALLGEEIGDDILDRVFSRFCVGK